MFGYALHIRVASQRRARGEPKNDRQFSPVPERVRVGKKWCAEGTALLEPPRGIEPRTFTSRVSLAICRTSKEFTGEEPFDVGTCLDIGVRVAKAMTRQRRAASQN